MFAKKKDICKRETKNIYIIKNTFVRNQKDRESNGKLKIEGKKRIMKRKLRTEANSKFLFAQ
jgi:hypothetical protein